MEPVGLVLTLGLVDGLRMDVLTLVAKRVIPRCVDVLVSAVRGFCRLTR